MKRTPFPHLQRRSKLINPNLQGTPALLVAAVILAAAALVGWVLFRDVRLALGTAANSGHFGFPTPFRIVGDILVRRLLLLFALVFAGGSLSFLWSLRTIRREVSRLAETFERSGTGDLSSPTDARGFREFVEFGREVDEARNSVLALVGEVRREAAAMRGSALPEEEFASRWIALQDTIRRVVP